MSRKCHYMSAFVRFVWWHWVRLEDHGVRFVLFRQRQIDAIGTIERIGRYARVSINLGVADFEMEPRP